MYATAAWLAWVLSLQAGDGALLATLAGAILIAFGLWAWSAARDAKPRGRRIAAAFAAFALAGAGALVAWADRGVPARRPLRPIALGGVRSRQLEAAQREEGRCSSISPPPGASPASSTRRWCCAATPCGRRSSRRASSP
jgi:thiol:disulfide interchange protein